MWNVPPGIRIIPGGDAAGDVAHADAIAAIAAAIASRPRKHENTKNNLAVVVS
jgi:hypothetical protein